MEKKLKTRNIAIILSMLLFCIIATACEKGSQESSSVIATESILTETTTSTIETTATSHTTTVTTVATESATSMATTATGRTTTVTTMTTESETSMVTTISEEELAEKQLVKEILLINDPYYPEEYLEEDADYMIHCAEPFSENLLGSITSEEDAEEKGRAILIKWRGQKFVDKLESDYVDIDGKPIKLERDNPPYSVKYYEKQDAWVVEVVLRSGKLEDGSWIATPGTPPYVILRGSDGKVLAIF